MTNLKNLTETNKIENAVAHLEAGNVFIYVETNEIEESVRLDFEDFMEQVNASQDADWDENHVCTEIDGDKYKLPHNEFVSYHIAKDTLVELFNNNFKGEEEFEKWAARKAA